PEIVTVSPDIGIRNTRLPMFPSTASTSAPAPLIVTLVSTSNSPLVRLMTPDIPVASIVSPSFAIASAWRNEPRPLSLVLLTMIVVARAEIVRAQARVKQIAADVTLLTLLHRRIALELQLFESNVVVTFRNYRTT